MKKKNAIIIVIAFVVIFAILVWLIISYYHFVDDTNSYDINNTFVIGNWNLQIFGDKKANDTELMATYVDVIRHYDIIFLQEIRDKDASSFHELCSSLLEYSCNISSRAGRSSSKEQYGIVYLKKFRISKIVDYNPDMLDRWERPPVRVDFSYGNYSFSAYDIHTKPEATTEELRFLEELVDKENNSRNVLVLGDLNADCYYFDADAANIFSSWHWIIKISDDTTTGPSNCAYDRMILNPDMDNEFVDYGIYTENIGEKTSDHYPVWIRVRDYDYTKDLSIGAFLSSMI